MTEDHSGTKRLTRVRLRNRLVTTTVIISLVALMKNVTAGLFGTFDRVSGTIRFTDFDENVVREILLIEPPLWCSWAVLFLICAVCLAILSWKVKAYEVVR